jgi:hypothetical protein
VAVINLNRFRKKKLEEEARKQADANARRHGRTKVDRDAASKQKQKLDRDLDGARRDPDDALGDPAPLEDT